MHGMRGFTARSLLLTGLVVLMALFGAPPTVQAFDAQALLHAASFQNTVAPGGLASLFGENLAAEVEIAELNAEGELPTTLAGVSVHVAGIPARLLFVSPSQINLLVPAETQIGTVTISVSRTIAGEELVSTVEGTVAATAPGLFFVNCLHPDRAAAQDAVTFALGPFRPASIDVDAEGRIWLSLYGSGIRGANEAVEVYVTDRTGRVVVIEAEYAGPAPGFEGLDQINIALSAEMAALGAVRLEAIVDGRSSNAVSIDLAAPTLPTASAADYLIRTFAGVGMAGHAGDGLAATLAELSSPHDVAVGPDGSLYVADAGNRVVRRILPSGVIETLAGTGEEGSGGDGGPAAEATLVRPEGVAVDALGNVYVADAGAHKVRRIGASGIITTLAGTGVAGFGGDGAAATAAQLSSPSGVDVNPYGGILVADTGNHRIRLITGDGRIQTIAGTGAAGDAGDGGPAIEAELDSPTSVAVSALNVVFVADSGNRKVRRIDAAGTIHTIAGTGEEGDVDNPGVPLESDFRGPLSLALDPHERLLFSDSANNRLRIYGLDCLIRLLAGTGEPGFSGDGGPAVEAGLNAPAGPDADLFGDIFVADAENHRVRQLWRRLGDSEADCGQIAVILFEPAMVIGGETIHGYVRLNCPSDEDVTVLLSSDQPGVPVPASVTIPAGQLGTSFTIGTPETGEPLRVIVTGTTPDGSETTGGFTILPGSGPGIESLTIMANAVVGGQSTTGVVRLGAPAPPGGLLVELASDSEVGQVADSVVVPEGAIVVQFSIGTTPVDQTTPVRITGTTGDRSAQDSFLVLPAGDGGPGLQSFVLNPSTVVGGDSSTGVLTLDGPAPAGGFEVFLSSNRNIATLSSSVLIPEGETSVQFTIATTTTPTRVVATLEASAATTLTARLTVTPESASEEGMLGGLSLAPSTVEGGQPSTGTVTLIAPAPAGGLVVNLTSNSPGASVPASIVIPEGQTTGQFAVSTTPAASQQTAQITATAANSVTATLTIDTAPSAGGDQVVGLSLSPAVVEGGQSSTGTITLGAAAPAGGMLVTLSSDNATASVPASIVVPQGATTAQFTVTTSTTGSQQTAQITATAGSAASASLTINPTAAGQGQIAGLSLSPGTVDGGDPSTGTVTLSGAAPAGGVLVTLASNDTNASVPGSIVIPEGETTGQFTVSTSPTASPKTAQITATSANSVNANLSIAATSAGQGQISGLSLSPSTVEGGDPSTGAVTLASPAPVGGILVTLSSDDTGATVPTSIVIPEGQTSGQFTVSTSPAASPNTAQITATSANSVNATLTINPTPAGQGQISGLSLSPSTVEGGDPSTGAVTLVNPAPVGGILVNLSSDDAAATVPASITIPEGQTSGQFTVSTSPAASPNTAQITATSANSVNATLTINPTPAGQGQLAGLTLNPTTVEGGDPSTGTVTLVNPAPAGGILVNLSSDDAAASVPASITIPEGQTSGQFTVSTSPSASLNTAQITATSANSVNATLTINPTSAGQGQLAGLTLNPTTVEGGDPSTGAVTLANPAPAGGILVSLSSNNGAATVPASIVIPEGQTSGQFTVSTSAVGSQQAAQITATSANSVNQTLTINPSAACVGTLELNVSITNLLNGNGVLTATVNLDGPAPAGGAQVNLIRSGVNIGVVNIAEGQTSGTVNLNINNLLAIVGSTVQAVLGGCPGIQATIALSDPITANLASLALNPSTVEGGQSSTGTVTLSAPAGSNGALINLSSDDPAASVPAQIAVPAGQTTAQFTVSTSPSASPNTALITATSANSVNATLTINPTAAGQGQLSSLALDPTAVEGGDPSTGTVTLASPAPTGGILVSLSSNNGAATVPASIVIPEGQTSGQFTVTTSAVGSQQAAQITATSASSVNANLTINPPPPCVSTLDLDVSITDLLSGDGILSATAGLDGPAPAGGYQIQLVRAGADIGAINIAEGETSGSVNLNIANLLSIVGSTVQAVLDGCPAVHATIVLGDPVTGNIASLSLDPPTVFAGQSVTGLVTLSAPAGENGVLVELSTNNPSATVISSSVVVPAGQTSTTFPINTVNTSPDPVVVEITASSGVSNKSANLTINSSNPCVESLQLTVNITNLLTGEGVLNGLVTLTGPAPAGGSNVPLLVGDTQIGQVAIPANQSTGAFDITVANLPTLLGSTLRAVLGPCGVQATITLAVPSIAGLTLPASLTLGASAMATITLDEPAPEGGAVIELQKNPLGLVGDLLEALLGAVVIPNQVVVAEGQTQVTFQISSSVIGGVLGLLLPDSVDVEIEAALQSAFSNSTADGVIEIVK